MISPIGLSRFGFMKPVNLKTISRLNKTSERQFKSPNFIIPSYHFNRSYSTQPQAIMTLSVGDTIPNGTFSYIPYSPELDSPNACGNAIKLKTDQWKGKKIVLFGLPGAFTKSCSANHLPSFIENASEIKSKGVSEIYCLATNDPFVMSGWGRLMKAKDNVHMISDSSLAWLEPAGLTVDLSKHDLGTRANRFALIIDDLKVTYVGVESDAGAVSVSGAEAVLPKL